MKKINAFSNETKEFLNRKKLIIRYIALVILNGAIFAYFFAALAYWDAHSEYKYEYQYDILIIFFTIFYADVNTFTLIQMKYIK